jgi:hypothetical protein
LVEIVYLDLLFQIPKKYARIIGGKGEEASSRGSTMEEREMLKNTQEHIQTIGEETHYIGNQNMAIGKGNLRPTGGKPASLGSTPDQPVHIPATLVPHRVPDAQPGQTG